MRRGSRCRSLVRVAWVTLVAALVTAAPGWAQLPTAAIRGLVFDQQNAVLPGATVSVTNEETGLVRTTVTNEAGLYRVAALPSGPYEVVVELQGFQKQTRKVELVLNQEAEVNFTLALAGRTEVVTVTAASPIIETAKSELSRTFSSRQVRDLPLAGRNFLNLMLTVPGVTTGGTGGSGFNAAVNGQRGRNINFIIDGSDNNDASVPNPRSLVIQDAVGEFRIVTSLFAAEYGRNSGAVAIATIKSGTNTLHGTAFEYYEDAEKLNARDNLEKAAGFTKPGKLRRDRYGFTFGGPVQKDKMFFFGAYQRTPFAAAGAAVPISSPTQEGRALLAGIPGVDPLMLGLLNKFVPLPNSGTTGSTTVAGVRIPLGDFIATLPNTSLENQLVLRVDRNLSQSDQVYGRYLYRKTETVGASNPPGFGNDSLFPTHNLVGTWNRIFTEALLNEFHFSYGRTRGGFPGSKSNPAGNNDLPTLSVTSLFDIGLQTNIPQDRTEQVYQFTDSISYLRGTHAFKLGADIRKVNLAQFTPFDFRGTYTFQTLSQFVFNTPFSALQAYGDATLPFLYPETFFFGQDDWKVTPHLTLNLGLRYERVAAANKFYSNVATDNNNFAPRTGFAWDISKRGVTVIRGGYGITYDQFFLNIPLLAGQGPPFQRRITDFTGAFKYPSVPADRQITPAELLTLNLIDVPDDARTPYGQQWQLGIERQIGATWRAEAAYVGSRGLKLLRQRVGNPVFCCPRERVGGPTGPFRRFGNPERTGQDTLLETSASSLYHSAQFSVEKRLRQGISLSVAYTWSRFIDDASESLGTGTPTSPRPQDNFDLRAERSRSAFDRPHRLVVSWLWELPFLRDQPGILGRIAGGWNFSGIYTAQSGQPFSIVTGVDSNGDGDSLNDRPNINPGGDPRTVNGSVQRPAFSGGQGTLGRNTGRGPGTNNWNMVLFKTVRTVKDHQVQFRAEFFNALNHRQFVLRNNARDRNLSVPGQFYDFRSSNGGNRSVVLGLRYLF